MYLLAVFKIQICCRHNLSPLHFSSHFLLVSKEIDPSLKHQTDTPNCLWTPLPRTPLTFELKVSKMQLTMLLSEPGYLPPPTPAPPHPALSL